MSRSPRPEHASTVSEVNRLLSPSTLPDFENKSCRGGKGSCSSVGQPLISQTSREASHDSRVDASLALLDSLLLSSMLDLPVPVSNQSAPQSQIRDRPSSGASKAEDVPEAR